MEKIPCSVEILTLNSEKTLQRTLESVKDFAEILILDGNSTDKTRAIAEQFGARIISQGEDHEPNKRVSDFGAVRNKGLGLASYPWFLYIDSDEYLSPEAVQEIKMLLQNPHITPAVYRLPRKYVLDGEIIERASVYPNFQYRFFHTQSVEGFMKKVHETLKRKPGYELRTLQFPEYVPLDSLAVVQKKNTRYLDIQQEILKNLSFGRLLRGIRSNTKKFFAYSIKYLLTFIRGTGKRMPFGYEYANATYHVRLMGRMIQNYIRNLFGSNPSL